MQCGPCRAHSRWDPTALPQPLLLPQNTSKMYPFPLQAKLAELQALEQLLDDAALTSEKFQRWKEEHQDLYQELQEWRARQQGQDSSGRHKAEQRPPAEAAEP